MLPARCQRTGIDMDTDGGFVSHAMWAKVRATYGKSKPVATVAALALAFTLQTASAQPTSCYPAGATGEGFPVVQCADGATWYQDMDGQPYANAAGYPVYAPGTWVQMTP
jgi:hypothetical protein